MWSTQNTICTLLNLFQVGNIADTPSDTELEVYLIRVYKIARS